MTALKYRVNIRLDQHRRLITWKVMATWRDISQFQCRRSEAKKKALSSEFDNKAITDKAYR
ncbi:MAG: hypothetical protein CMJ78_17595 [Planctomycetaceae bacterium]|nr:hypothetical protein [Planctomycetaceae bacterium]